MTDMVSRDDDGNALFKVGDICEQKYRNGATGQDKWFDYKRPLTEEDIRMEFEGDIILRLKR